MDRNERVRQKYAEDSEPFKKRNDKYREANREKIRARTREYNARPEVKARQKAWREANKERFAEHSRKSRGKMGVVIRTARDTPCVDCGLHLPPEIMEFDHVRGQKKFTISHWEKQCRSTGTGKSRLELIQEEIAKCEIRCPNCHRMRHYREDSGNFASSYPVSSADE